MGDKGEQAGNEKAPENAQTLFSGVREVDERHAVDETALFRFMEEAVNGFVGPLRVFQFKGGQSNPTYFLQTPPRNYVLRRKPPGKLLPSAHAVDREYRVISALKPLGFPVATPYALCVDESVIGTMFYVMEHVDGRILWDSALPDVDNAHRAAVFRQQIDVLAQLHKVDWQQAGLQDFGKTGSYFTRQIGRWSTQYKASETRAIHEMDRLIEFLPANVPANETVSIVHGDFRLDNMILHPTEPRILAVLDWELSTLGDPLADFTYYLMQWVMPRDVRGLMGLDYAGLEIPTIDEVVANYCALTGRDSIPQLDFFFSYNLFRLAAICQGIVGRVRDGTAASANAAAMEARVLPLAQAAWHYAKQAGA